jgi:predicted ester cyclase
MGVKLEFKHKKKGILGIGSSSGKGIRFSDKSVADSINEKLLNAYDNVE